MNRNKLYAIGLVLALASVALADVVYEALRPLPGTLANALPSTVSSADTNNYDTPLRPRKTRGDPKVIVSPSCSVQGATVCLEVIVYERPDVPAGATAHPGTIAAIGTFTANATNPVNGRYWSDDGFLLAPTLSCQVYDVRVRSISTGNVTWKSWTGGANSTSASTASE